MAKSETVPVTPAPEELSQAIVDIARGMKALNATRLKRETIVLLVSRASGVGMRECERVINSLNQLETRYLKPEPAKVLR